MAKVLDLIYKNRLGFLCLILSLIPYVGAFLKVGCTNFYADISGLVALLELLLLVCCIIKKIKGSALIVISMVISIVGYIVLITFC
jgi:hypothetical protein